MKQPVPKPPAPDRETPLEFLSSNCALIVVVLFVFAFLFENFAIPSSSMASTLLVGDHVFVERASLAPASGWAPFLHYRTVQRGDIIVFYKPVLDPDGEHTPLVKRVIGIPGDRIHLSHGTVWLNGVPQSEPHAVPTTGANYDPYIDDFPAVPPSLDAGVTPDWFIDLSHHVRDGDLVVPPGHYFVMGDNRHRSLDSRFWGFVPRENILGRPLFVYWSIDSPEVDDLAPPLSARAASTLHDLLHFFDKTRWSRTFHPIQ
jgi:signal peptidase I